MLLIPIILFGFLGHSQDIEITIPQIKQIRLMAVDLENALTENILLKEEIVILKEKNLTLDHLNANNEKKISMLDANYLELAKAFNTDQQYINTMEAALDRQQNKQKWKDRAIITGIVVIVGILIIK